MVSSYFRKRSKFYNCLQRMLDERTAGSLSVGFLNIDTESLRSDVTLDERDRDPNDEILVPSPAATREEPSVNFGWLFAIYNRSNVPQPL